MTDYRITVTSLDCCKTMNYLGGFWSDDHTSYYMFTDDGSMETLNIQYCPFCGTKVK